MNVYYEYGRFFMNEVLNRLLILPFLREYGSLPYPCALTDGGFHILAKNAVFSLRFPRKKCLSPWLAPADVSGAFGLRLRALRGKPVLLLHREFIRRAAPYYVFLLIEDVRAADDRFLAFLLSEENDLLTRWQNALAAHEAQAPDAPASCAPVVKSSEIEPALNTLRACQKHCETLGWAFRGNEACDLMPLFQTLARLAAERDFRFSSELAGDLSAFTDPGLICLFFAALIHLLSLSGTDRCRLKAQSSEKSVILAFSFPDRLGIVKSFERFFREKESSLSSFALIALPLLAAVLLCEKAGVNFVFEEEKGVGSIFLTLSAATHVPAGFLAARAKFSEEELVRLWERYFFDIFL